MMAAVSDTHMLRLCIICMDVYNTAAKADLVSYLSSDGPMIYLVSQVSQTDNAVRGVSLSYWPVPLQSLDYSPLSM